MLPAIVNQANRAIQHFHRFGNVGFIYFVMKLQRNFPCFIQSCLPLKVSIRPHYTFYENVLQNSFPKFLCKHLKAGASCFLKFNEQLNPLQNVKPYNKFFQAHLPPLLDFAGFLAAFQEFSDFGIEIILLL